MNKYNKGVTIIEILMSVVIIGIVMLFLFGLLTQVKHEEESNQIQSIYVMNQASFQEAIEEDIVNYGIKSIKGCSINDYDLTASVSVDKKDVENYKCIELDYAADYVTDNIGVIMIYNYYTKYDQKTLKGTDSKWMLRYIRGHRVKSSNSNRTSWVTGTYLMKELPNGVNLNFKPYVKYIIRNSNNYMDAGKLIVPIVSDDDVHYDLYIGFVLPSGSDFKCDENNISSNENEKIKCYKLN